MRAASAILGPALALLASAAGAQDIEVKVESEPGADFSRLRTYDWVETQEPAADPVNHALITRAVERELQAKGLRKATDGKPALRVRYYAKVEKKVRGRGTKGSSLAEPTNLRTTVDFKRVEEGTLIVELFDNESRLTLWRGVASGMAPRPDEVQEVIDDAVQRLFAKYPPNAG